MKFNQYNVLARLLGGGLKQSKSSRLLPANIPVHHTLRLFASVFHRREFHQRRNTWDVQDKPHPPSKSTKTQALVYSYLAAHLTTRCPRRPVAPATNTCDGFAVIATVAVCCEFRRMLLVPAARARPISGEGVRPLSPKAETAPRPEAAATNTRRVLVAVVVGLAAILRVLPL